MSNRLLAQLLETRHVQAVILFSFEGEAISVHGASDLPGEGDVEETWGRLIEALQGVREADLVFERNRLHIRATGLGYLVVVMGIFAPAPMVRMICDMLRPSLIQQDRTSSLSFLFKKKHAS